MPENAAEARTRPEYATWPRRIVALLVDWVASALVTVLIIGPTRYGNDPASGWYVMGIYLVEATLGTALAAASFGQLLVGIRVRRVDGRPLSLLAALLRTFLICLVVPPLIFKSGSGRGLHDLATHAAAYRFSRR